MVESSGGGCSGNGVGGGKGGGDGIGDMITIIGPKPLGEVNVGNDVEFTQLDPKLLKLRDEWVGDLTSIAYLITRLNIDKCHGFINLVLNCEDGNCPKVGLNRKGSDVVMLKCLGNGLDWVG